jgi:hypothetical protein
LPLAVLAWAAFTLRWGYVVGADDHYEFAASALLGADANFLPTDLFINSLRALAISERTLFGAVMGALLPLGHWVWLALHSVAFISLALGLARLGQLVGLRTLVGQWGALAVSLFVLYHYNTGGTELAYNNFQSASVADAAGVWAFCLSLRGRLWGAVGLLAVATAGQPLVGANLGVLCGALWLWQAGVQRSLPWGRVALALAGWLATSGVWIGLIWLGYQQGREALSDAEFFHAMFRVRAPHHFLPSAFPLAGWGVMTSLAVAGLWGLGKRRHPLVAVLAVLVLGSAVYSVGVEGFESFAIGSTQWFRATQWVKPLGVMAVLLWLEGRTMPLWLLQAAAVAGRALRGWRLWAACGLGAAACFLAIYTQNAWGPLAGKPYYLPGLQHRHPEWAIAQDAQRLTPTGALFIQPHSFTALTYWGQRAAFVSWKGVARGRAPLGEWLRRYEWAYYGPQGFSAVRQPASGQPDYWQQAPAPFWQLARSQGVTHVLAPAGWQPPIPMQQVASQGPYTIWALP